MSRKVKIAILAIVFVTTFFVASFVFLSPRPNSKPLEVIVLVDRDWFSTATEALQYALNKMENNTDWHYFQMFAWGDGFNLTRYDATVHPSTKYVFGYDVEVTYYGQPRV